MAGIKQKPIAMHAAIDNCRVGSEATNHAAGQSNLSYRIIYVCNAQECSKDVTHTQCASKCAGVNSH